MLSQSLKSPNMAERQRFESSNDDSNVPLSKQSRVMAISQSANNNLHTQPPSGRAGTQVQTNANKFALQRALQEKEIARIVHKLPYKIREGVNSVVTMAMSQSENIFKDLEVSKLESAALRTELQNKTVELNTLKKTAELYQEKARYLAENVETLKDNVNARQKFTIKNRSAISKLASTNRLLIDSLDALQAKNTLAQPMKPQRHGSYDFDTMQAMHLRTSGNHSASQHDLTTSILRRQATAARSNLLLPISGNMGNSTPFSPSPVGTPQNIMGTNNNNNSNNLAAFPANGGHNTLLGSHNPVIQKINMANEAAEQFEQTEKKYTMFQNDKLRESLLRVAREHYKSQKNGQILEQKVNELRVSLKVQEQMNRKLKSEVEELRHDHSHGLLASSTSLDGKPPPKDGTASGVKALGPSSTPSATMNTNSVNTENLLSVRLPKKFGAIDNKFKALLDRNGFDPIDGIQQLRRIIAHIATAPQNLNLNDTIRHVVAKDASRIFDSHMVSFFMLKQMNNSVAGGASGNKSASGGLSKKAQFLSNSKLLKYNVKSHKPELLDLAVDTKSLAVEVIYNNKLLRLNTIHSSNAYYNVGIDGVSGIISKRMLFLPIYNTYSDTVIGCIQLLNKGHNNEPFSELDEIFALLYADSTSLLITNCLLYEKVAKRSNLYQSLLESTTLLYAVIPESTVEVVLPPGMAETASLAPSSNKLTLGAVLKHIEVTAKDIMKCTAARVFIVSDLVAGHTPGQLIQLEHPDMASDNDGMGNSGKSNGNKGSGDGFATITVPATSGIAGYVIQTKAIYQLADSSNSFDPYLNPTIDLDSILFSMVTIPLINPQNRCVGCIQFALGPNSLTLSDAHQLKHSSTSSPTKSTPGDVKFQSIHFVEAAVWMCYQFIQPIEHLLDCVNAVKQEACGTMTRNPTSASAFAHMGQSALSLYTANSHGSHNSTISVKPLFTPKDLIRRSNFHNDLSHFRPHTPYGSGKENNKMLFSRMSTNNSAFNTSYQNVITALPSPTQSLGDGENHNSSSNQVKNPSFSHSSPFLTDLASDGDEGNEGNNNTRERNELRSQVENLLIQTQELKSKNGDLSLQLEIKDSQLEQNSIKINDFEIVLKNQQNTIKDLHTKLSEALATASVSNALRDNNDQASVGSGKGIRTAEKKSIRSYDKVSADAATAEIESLTNALTAAVTEKKAKDNQINELESKMKALKDDFVKSQMDLTIAEKTATDATADIIKLKAQIERLQAELTQAMSDKANSEQTSVTTQMEIEKLTAEVATLSATLNTVRQENSDLLEEKAKQQQSQQQSSRPQAKTNFVPELKPESEAVAEPIEPAEPTAVVPAAVVTDYNTAALEGEINILYDKVQSLESDNERLETQAKSLTSELTTLKDRLSATDSQSASDKAKIEQLTTNLTTLTEDSNAKVVSYELTISENNDIITENTLEISNLTEKNENLTATLESYREKIEFYAAKQDDKETYIRDLERQIEFFNTTNMFVSRPATVSNTVPEGTNEDHTVQSTAASVKQTDTSPRGTSGTGIGSVMSSAKSGSVKATSGVTGTSGKLLPGSAPVSARASPRAPPLAPGSRAPSGQLIPDDKWIELVDSNGSLYYYNNFTGESSWTNPNASTKDAVHPAAVVAENDGLGGEADGMDDYSTGVGIAGPEDDAHMQAGATADAADNGGGAPIAADDGVLEIGDWIKQYDESTGREYWLHQISGESQWERPSSDESGQGELDGAGGAGHNSIYDTNASHYSATAGDYTIEL